MINLTPHAITIRTPEGGDITIPPSGVVAKVATQEEMVDTLNGVPVIRRTFGAVTGLTLPAQEPVLVSSMVLGALPQGTRNVFAPDTGATAIRENGQVVAATRLVAA